MLQGIQSRVIAAVKRLLEVRLIDVRLVHVRASAGAHVSPKLQPLGQHLAGSRDLLGGGIRGPHSAQQGVHERFSPGWVHGVGLVDGGIDAGLDIVSEHEARLNHRLADGGRLRGKRSGVLPVAAGEEARPHVVGPGADHLGVRREGRGEGVQEAVVLDEGDILWGHTQSGEVGEQRGDELLQLGDRGVVRPVWCHAEAAAGLRGTSDAPVAVVARVGVTGEGGPHGVHALPEGGVGDVGAGADRVGQGGDRKLRIRANDE